MIESLYIDGKEYTIDEFSLGDLEWLEDYLGFSLDDPKALTSMKAAVAFVYLVKKQDNPAYTLDDARGEKVAVLTAPEDDAVNGTSKAAAKRPPTKRAARS